MKCFQIRYKGFKVWWPMTHLTHTGRIYRSIVIARFRDWLFIWLPFSHVPNVKCINFLSVFRLPSLIMMYWRWSEPTWSLLAPLPHHCLMSSAAPSGSWIRGGGGFLPRSITDPDHVSIKHTATAAWHDSPVWILRQTASLFFVFKFQLICWFLCQVVVMCLGVLTPL